MAPSIGSSPNRPQFQPQSVQLPSWVHPEVTYWIDEWRMIRDVCAGEKEVKAQGTAYLPKLEGMDQDEYATYVERATFFNFSGRTVAAMSGAIFRRKEVIEGLPAKLEPRLKQISRERQSFRTFATHTAQEIFAMGRFGVLVDLPVGPSTDPRPYFTAYPAETILDWDVEEIDGRIQLVSVTLMEQKLIRDAKTFAQRYIPQYRRIRLVNGDTVSGRMCVQELFSDPDKPVEFTDAFKTATIVPQNRGKPLEFVPFHIFGPFLSTPSVEKPPMQDIARLNVSHFRSYAALEHGRFYVGFPLYYVEAGQGGGESEADFTLGASRVWVTPTGAKPGILEMNGQGLKFLQDALDQKEQQAATIGGRMMGVRTTAVAESDNMLKLSERNEQSALLKVTESLDAGFTLLLQWWALMQDIPQAEAEKIEVEFNKDFLFDTPGAREFRALHSMYKDGVIPISVIFHYMKKANAIPDWMDEKEFMRLLDRMDQFPNNPDVQARKEGFPNALAKQQSEENDLDREHELELQDDQNSFDEQQASLDRKSDEKKSKDAAKAAAKAPKPVPGTPGAPKPGGFGSA